jgi:uncharacterized protein YjcR
MSQPMSKKELRNYYNVSYYTLKKWLAPHTAKIGDYVGGRYTAKQVNTIKEILG